MASYMSNSRMKVSVVVLSPLNMKGSLPLSPPVKGAFGLAITTGTGTGLGTTGTGLGASAGGSTIMCCGCGATRGGAGGNVCCTACAICARCTGKLGFAGSVSPRSKPCCTPAVSTAVSSVSGAI